MMEILMKRMLSTVVLLLASASFMPGVKAQTIPRGQAEPTTEQIQQACASDRAETLPIPFSDIEPGHWAFKAVMNLYYCGAYLKKT
jgi:hypothetical protein